MLALWKKSNDKLRQCVEKQRHYFTKVRIVKWTGRPGVLQFMGSQRVGHDWATELTELMVFPVVMYRCESWTIKKAEHQRIDAFELWCWRRLLKVPWTARRSIPNIHWKDWCWSWSSNTLATCCIESTHWKRTWCWERLKAEGEGSSKGWDS